jgi:hypothetical protein
MQCQVIDCVNEANRTIHYLCDPWKLGGLKFKFGVIFNVCIPCFDKAIQTGEIKEGYDPFIQDKPLFICRGK